MTGSIIVWCAPPILLGIALAWAAGPALELGGPWRQLRRGIFAMTIVALLGPLLALYQVSQALAGEGPAEAEERATLLASTISESLNLGAFVFMLGLVGQLLALGFVLAGRKRVKRSDEPS